MKLIVTDYTNDRTKFHFISENQKEVKLIETMSRINYIDELTQIIKDEYNNSKKYRSMVNQHILNREGKRKKEICLSIINDIIAPTRDIICSKYSDFVNKITWVVAVLYHKLGVDLEICWKRHTMITFTTILIVLEELTDEPFYIKEFIEGKI